MRMEFFGGRWYCDFHEHNLASRIGRRRQVDSDDKLRAMIQRAARDKTKDAMRMIDYAIDRGRGEVWLLLTQEQYEALKR